MAHFLLHCSKYKEKRLNFYSKYLDYVNIGGISDIELLKLLLANNEKHLIAAAANYRNDIMLLRAS